MIEFTNYEAWGFEHAVRGMRNSYKSHGKSDSEWNYDEFTIGENDKGLARRLANAGQPSHRKYLRQINVWVDINAPLYWWKEYATYKIGTTENSESTMHTIQKEVMVDELFSVEPPNDEEREYWEKHLEYLEHLRNMFNTTKDKKYWRYLIQLLPDGWMQKRTCHLNYEVLANLYHDRNNHRLSEWADMREWIRTLPHSYLITGKE